MYLYTYNEIKFNISDFKLINFPNISNKFSPFDK